MVTDIDNPGPQFPLFPINDRLTVDLQPADVLYIPALWFHNMKVQIWVKTRNRTLKNKQVLLLQTKYEM